MTEQEIKDKRYLLDVISTGIGVLGFIGMVALIVTK